MAPPSRATHLALSTLEVENNAAVLAPVAGVHPWEHIKHLLLKVEGGFPTLTFCHD